MTTRRRPPAKPAAKPAAAEKRAWSMQPFAARPRLSIALAVGLAVGLGLTFGVPSLRPSTCIIIGWDVTCAALIGSVLTMMAGATPADIRKVSAAQDEGKVMILVLVILAAAASLGAVANELSLAKQDGNLLRSARVGLAFATVAASWFVVQLIFALHYAHGFYGVTKGSDGGLLFPGKEDPDYWDFVHFALVIGVASQTADIAFTSKSLRRVGTWHSAIAFTFNTVVLALTINLLASLF